MQDNTLLTLLQEGKKEIERALKWQGLDLGVLVKQKIIPPTKEQQDISVLKEFFGDKINII